MGRYFLVAEKWLSPGPAYIAAATALLVLGIPASLQQHRYAPIVKDEGKHAPVDWMRVGIVALILIGFGGSMIWFGSSAGVAISNMYPEARSVGLWLRHGWHIMLAYVLGFLVMLAVLGWNPEERDKARAPL